MLLRAVVILTLIKINVGKDCSPFVPCSCSYIHIDQQEMDASSRHDFKLKVDCSKRNLTSFPDLSHFSEVVVLVVSNNKITEFPYSEYLPKLLISLDLSNNLIEEINTDLQNATTIQEIDLSVNKLEVFPSGTMLPPNLKRLKLGSNVIKSFSKQSFVKGSVIENLDLFNNKLEYDPRIFYDDLFTNAIRLKNLNIGDNTCKHGINSQMYKTLTKLQSLETLYIDAYSDTFTDDFVNLGKLTIMSLFYCQNVSLTRNYFVNVPHLEELDLSCKGSSICETNPSALISIERGSISTLRNLRILDISRNQKLGFCGFKNITLDLPFTSIEVFKAQQINCPFGLSTTLFINDLKPLSKTNLTDLYLDRNKIEYLETYAPTYLPATLKKLSVTFNRLRLGKYKTDGISVLTGIETVDVSYQDKTEMRKFSYWEWCDDFESSIKCQAERLDMDNKFLVSMPNNFKNNKYIPNDVQLYVHKDTKMEHFLDNKKTILDNRQYNCSGCPFPVDCSSYFDFQWYNYIIPPNTRNLFFQSSYLGDSINNQYVSTNTLERISLDGNNFRHFIGPVCNVSNVKFLNLSSNMCSYITEYFFVGFTGLISLHLQENNLGDEIKKFENGQIFRSQSYLRHLNMSINRIDRLPSKIFLHTANLEVIDLSKNLLTDWGADVSHLQKLRYVNLSYNFIEYISDNAIEELDKINQAAVIDLSNNNFVCSCDSLPFFTWMQSRSKRHPGYFNYTCRLEHNGTSRIVNSEIYELQKICSSKLAIFLLASTALILTTICIIGGIIYRYRWKIRFWYYAANRTTVDFKFDFFLSYAYSHRRIPHLVKVIVQELEVQRNLKVCVSDRDFIPGCNISENIINAIHNSRRTVCLISRAFLNSHWCMYELNIALVERMWERGGENIIILVFIEDIEKDSLPNFMKEIISSETYIEHTDLRNLGEKLEDTLVA